MGNTRDDDADDMTDPRSYSVEEIFTIAERQASEPWPAHEGLQAVEEGFRTGYLYGWQHAVDAVFRLMQERGFTHMQAALAADAHQAHALRLWRNAAHPDVLGHPLFAPTCDLRRDLPPTFLWQQVSNPDDSAGEDDEDSER